MPSKDCARRARGILDRNIHRNIGLQINVLMHFGLATLVASQPCIRFKTHEKLADEAEEEAGIHTTLKLNEY